MSKDTKNPFIVDERSFNWRSDLRRSPLIDEIIRFYRPDNWKGSNKNSKISLVSDNRNRLFDSSKITSELPDDTKIRLVSENRNSLFVKVKSTTGNSPSQQAPKPDRGKLPSYWPVFPEMSTRDRELLDSSAPSSDTEDGLR